MTSPAFAGTRLGSMLGLVRFRSVLPFALALAIAFVLGSSLFLSSLPPEARASLPEYLRASIRAGGPSSLHPERGAEERDRLASLYGGRTVSFLASQWIVRVAAASVVVILIFGASLF